MFFAFSFAKLLVWGLLGLGIVIGVQILCSIAIFSVFSLFAAAAVYEELQEAKKAGRKLSGSEVRDRLLHKIGIQEVKLPPSG